VDALGGQELEPLLAAPGRPDAKSVRVRLAGSSPGGGRGTQRRPARSDSGGRAGRRRSSRRRGSGRRVEDRERKLRPHAHRSRTPSLKGSCTTATVGTMSTLTADRPVIAPRTCPRPPAPETFDPDAIRLDLDVQAPAPAPPVITARTVHRAWVAGESCCTCQPTARKAAGARDAPEKPRRSVCRSCHLHPLHPRSGVAR
jgi:hypothetical protein